MNQNLKILLTAGASFASASLLPLGVSAQILAVGVYDPATNPNRVDNDILNPGTIITAQPTGAIGVADFTTSVAAAFASNLGGVIDFENGAINNHVRLGVDHSLGLNLTYTGFNTFAAAANGRIPISGDFRLNGDRSGTMDFGSFFDVATNAPLADFRVTQVGLTMLARQDRDWTGTVRATFSDTTTATFSIVQLGNYGTPADAANPPQDTFLGFTAPAGLGITRISFNQTGGGQFTLSIDDLGIIAIPEPSTYAAIIGLLGLAFVAWRRRARR
ncbi:MAG: PEP-CTERM sorting domain-containing protein [Opitutales bacterium]|nr:PEP-CTERM sorting domain-containing protein [Opitutales bacterium]